MVGSKEERWGLAFAPPTRPAIDTGKTRLVYAISCYT